MMKIPTFVGGFGGPREQWWSFYQSWNQARWDPEFAEGKNVILSTTCRLGGIIMVKRSFCLASRLIDYDEMSWTSISICTSSELHHSSLLNIISEFRIDRSRSLFKFVPQEKNITVKLARLFQATIKTTLRRGLANGTNSAPSCSTVPLENENRSQNDYKMIPKLF